MEPSEPTSVDHSAATVAPSGRRGRAWRRPAAASAVTAVVTGGAVLAAAAFMDPVQELPPPAAASSPARARGGHIQRVVEPCALLTGATAQRLVPKAEIRPSVDEHVTYCTWSTGLGVEAAKYRSLELRVHPYAAENGMTDVAVAASVLASTRSRWRARANTKEELNAFGARADFDYGPVALVPGLGEEAAFQHQIHWGELAGFGTGTVELTTRQENVVVDVVYGNNSSETEKTGSAVGVKELKEAAVAAAREALAHLRTCEFCIR
ncbi:hypothetical protein [Spirillospora sp. NBC_01491]|uniref:hypothetical protein n=1 Tax=Spirillospora sp. NBC_01491 TaxID=2976007 RepID=UPI002E339183|nr:hypothetical protein [Spirillospora sp. NBC_01491]